MIKGALVSILFIICSIVSFGQQRCPINDCMTQVLFSQMNNSIGRDLPLILNISGFIYFQKVNITHDIIYYHEKYNFDIAKKDFNTIAINEIIQSTKGNFIENDSLNRNILLKAYQNDRMLLSIKSEDEGKIQNIKLESLSNKYTKSFTYSNCSLIKTIIAKKGKIKFQTIIINRKSNGPENEAISLLGKDNKSGEQNYSLTQQNYFDANNRLSKINSLEGNGYVRDSIIFVYDNDLLMMTQKYSNNKKLIVEYKYDTLKQLIKKDVIVGKRLCHISYFYDDKRFLANVIISDNQSNKIFRISLTYNDAGKLVSATIWQKKNDRKLEELKAEYCFSYNERKNIKQFLEINKNGKVKKNVGFITEYLNQLPL